MRQLILVFSTLWWTPVASFGILPARRPSFRVLRPAFSSSRDQVQTSKDHNKGDPARVSAAYRYFSLEEMEDRDQCETELFFKPDGTLRVGTSDGPSFQDAQGTWQQNADGSFEMTLTRSYAAGHQGQRGTDMGEFEFKTERFFKGEMTFVGEKIAVTGQIFMKDDVLGDEEVGYFNLLDVSEERGDVDESNNSGQVRAATG